MAKQGGEVLKLEVGGALGATRSAVERDHGVDVRITIGRSGSGADLWCGQHQWLSASAGLLASDGRLWWLINPHGRNVLRFISDNGALDLLVGASGSVVLPPVSGRLWLAQLGSTADESVVVLIRSSSPVADVVEAAIEEASPSMKTQLLRPERPEVVEVLAAATWHRRYATGYRLLTQDEVANYLGVDVRTVRNRITSYRAWLADRLFFPFTGKTGYEEVCNVAIDHRVVLPEDDDRMAYRLGPPGLSDYLGI